LKNFNVFLDDYDVFSFRINVLIDFQNSCAKLANSFGFTAIFIEKNMLLNNVVFPFVN